LGGVVLSITVKMDKQNKKENTQAHIYLPLLAIVIQEN
jgi:hypothetical protein